MNDETPSYVRKLEEQSRQITEASQKSGLVEEKNQPSMLDHIRKLVAPFKKATEGGKIKEVSHGNIPDEAVLLDKVRPWLKRNVEVAPRVYGTERLMSFLARYQITAAQVREFTPAQIVQHISNIESNDLRATEALREKFTQPTADDLQKLVGLIGEYETFQGWSFRNGGIPLSFVRNHTSEQIREACIANERNKVECRFIA